MFSVILCGSSTNYKHLSTLNDFSHIQLWVYSRLTCSACPVKGKKYVPLWESIGSLPIFEWYIPKVFYLCKTHLAVTMGQGQCFITLLFKS